MGCKSGKRRKILRLGDKAAMKKPKPLRFLVDLNVGKQVEEWLKSQGYDVKSVRDIDPKAEDETILCTAAVEKRIVVTMDKDFGMLVYRFKIPCFGVLLLRLEEATAAEKIQVISRILRLHSRLLPGHFCVFQSGKFRARP